MSLSHRITRMTGRDPNESHRTATPLELLFDLTFVVAFSQASSQTAHLLELGHVGPALMALGLVTFGISWAWINYSWLASAYDNQDIFFRVATLVQMVGVLILAVGIPPVFHSTDEGAHLDNGVLVVGYVIMRVAAVALWLRAARHDPAHRRACLTYAAWVSAAQVGWIALIFADLSLMATFAVGGVLIAVEMMGPVFAERKDGGTPWHAHHIAERYGLLVIITLGEIVLGTILVISAVVEDSGWTVEAGTLAVSGTALAFGMWWVYFMMPSGRVLAVHRDRAFVWGYGHIVLFGSIIGVGAGLHVAANVIAHIAHVDALFAMWTVAIPAALFQVCVYVLYSMLLRQFDPFHVWLFAGSMVVLAASVASVGLGASLGAGLLVAALSPVVTIVGYETVGYRHQAEALERAMA